MTTPLNHDAASSFAFSNGLLGLTQDSVARVPTVTPLSPPAVSSTPISIGLPKPAEQPKRIGLANTELPLLETANIWGLNFARVDMPGIIEYADSIIQARECQYFITANLNYVMLTHEQRRLKAVNDNAAAVIADGFPIILRSQFLNDPLPERVAGADMIVELARLSAERGYRIFFLGAEPGVASKAAERLQAEFPELQVAGCVSPPFREPTPEEQAELFAEIRAAKPDILLVAFGQPKGELWIHQHFAELEVPLSIQLGASFDFLAGTAKRAPRFWQIIGCEWLYRSLSDPRRLGPRYAKNIAFLVKQVFSDLRTLLG